MGLLEMLRRKPGKEIISPSREQWVIIKYIDEGQKFEHKKGIGVHLPLEGIDKTLLHLFIGLKILYGHLDKSKRGNSGRSLTGESIGIREDSPNTARLRENAVLLEGFISEFVETNYQNARNRAWNMRLAVNNLLAQDPNKSHPLDSASIRAWGEYWRPRILSPQPTTA